jgi:hypothetical protein
MTKHRIQTLEGNGPPVEYKLVLEKSTDPSAGVAKLTSPLLDADMHSDRAVRVSISGFAGDPHAGKELAIHSFQIDSIVDYLSNQAKFRQALEKAIDAHLADSPSRRKIGRGSAAWKTVKVSFILLNPRNVRTRESLQGMKALLPKLNPAMLERLASKSNQPSTRSSLSLSLSGPWPDEHERQARFRDGKLVEFSLEG